MPSRFTSDLESLAVAGVAAQLSGAWTTARSNALTLPSQFTSSAAHSAGSRSSDTPLLLQALLAVADERGRKACYLAAAIAGLRRGDLERLIWADVDFDDHTITNRNGKANREDAIRMHSQLADSLRQRFGDSPALPTARVYPESVTSVTVKKDFLRAGIARREVVTDESGNSVMIGKSKRRRVKTTIVVEDDE